MSCFKEYPFLTTFCASFLLSVTSLRTTTHNQSPNVNTARWQYLWTPKQMLGKYWAGRLFTLRQFYSFRKFFSAN